MPTIAGKHPHKIIKANKISHFVMMGDSLSDRGTLNKKKLFGFIPMSRLSGLSKDSPLGRFTNGLTWGDNFSAIMANKFIVNSLKKELHMDSTDIADAMISGDARVNNPVDNSYNLKDDKGVKYNGKDLVRNYTEGGLTAHSYRGMPSYSISRFFARLILSTLEMKREKLFSDDKALNTSAKHKAETLVIEWSGPNDLMTVNAEPSKAEVDRAIKARIKNAEKLIRNGYINIVLFNLPDLFLTPRYQAMSKADQKNARDCSLYFNQELEKASKKLSAKYPQSSVNVFDINSTFTEVYNNPEKYGFEKSKLTKPYVKSKDFKENSNGTSPAEGYMFWDDVHPSADMHAILAELFYQQYQKSFVFTAPSTEFEYSQSLPNLQVTPVY
jgi:phospholipase/lecithinase/hemolysin